MNSDDIRSSVGAAVRRAWFAASELTLRDEGLDLAFQVAGQIVVFFNKIRACVFPHLPPLLDRKT